MVRLDSCVYFLNLSMPSLSSDFYLLSEVVSILLFLMSLPPRKPGRYFIICVKVSTVKVPTKQKSESNGTCSRFFVQIVEGNGNETWQIKVLLYVSDDYFWVDPALNLAKYKSRSVCSNN